MTINHIFLLLGGLGLFIYGMKLMSDGLKLIAGYRLKKILGKVTTNRWAAAGAGAFITAIIQSSTATTVMVLGLVNSGLLTLFAAITVIIGANVGTTISSMLLTFNIKPIAPFLIFMGTILFLFIKQKKLNHVGIILLGFGVLFLGLSLMSDSMMPLKDAAFMAELFELTRNPFFGILIGFAVTALIQSSTATIGIILSMITVGIITDLNQAIFIIYGLNLGGTVTALIASIGANRAAKQTAVANLIFNTLGVIIFLLLMLFQFDLAGIVKLMSTEVSQQLVFAHMIFNVVITLILLPLAKYIVKLAQIIVKSSRSKESELRFKYIDSRLLNTPAIAVEQTFNEIGRMMDIALDTYALSVSFPPKKQLREDITKNEETINFLDKEINKFLVHLNTIPLKQAHVEELGAYYRITGHLERIGDYSEDTAFAIAQYINDKRYSENSMKEVCRLTKKVEKLLNKSFDLYNSEVFDEEKLDDMKSYKKDIFALTKDNRFLAEISLMRIIYNLSRISDHAVLIAVALGYRKTPPEKIAQQ
ncbi:MAG: Na/Pi cotransporter family protein [Coriobacteriia bacterium]|nr:Na/Pi cotransporter family protein [Coriobacteriia bacterium]